MRILKKAVLVAAVGAVALFGAVEQAAAHAFSIGYENAGPNSVNIWLGTYQHGGHHLEGSLNLLGVNSNPFPSTTQPFTMLTPDGVLNKPSGLIDGVTNFYVSTALGVPGPLVASDAIWLSTLCPACGPANHWEGVNFSGLNAGDYQFTYVPIINPSAEWTPYNPSLNGIFTLSAAIVNPGPPSVPAPSTLALLGLGLAGLSFLGRRRN